MEILNHFSKSFIKFMKDWFLMDYQSLFGGKFLTVGLKSWKAGVPCWYFSLHLSETKDYTAYISRLTHYDNSVRESQQGDTEIALWTRKGQYRAPVPSLPWQAQGRHHQSTTAPVPAGSCYGLTLFPSIGTTWPPWWTRPLYIRGKQGQRSRLV